MCVYVVSQELLASSSPCVRVLLSTDDTTGLQTGFAHPNTTILTHTELCTPLHRRVRMQPLPLTLLLYDMREPLSAGPAPVLQILAAHAQVFLDLQAVRLECGSQLCPKRKII